LPGSAAAGGDGNHRLHDGNDDPVDPIGSGPSSFAPSLPARTLSRQRLGRDGDEGGGPGRAEPVRGDPRLRPSAQPAAVLKDPIALFQEWLQEAVDSGMKEPTAMTVATIDLEGAPDARMLLLKGHGERGFVFYTNLESAKAQALRKDPRVALCFFWAVLEK